MKPCTHCAQPAQSMVLCFDCVRKLQNKLRRLIWLIPQVQIDVTRQAKKQPPGQQRGNAEHPLVFDCEASEVAWVIDQTLSAWASQMGMRIMGVGTSPQALARKLSDRVLDLAMHPDAGQCVDEVSDAVTLAVRQIDRKPGMLYLGDCQCRQRIYAREEESETTCSYCGVSYMVAEVRAQNRAYGDSYPITARDAVRYLGEVHGRMLTTDRICTWARRGKFSSVGNHPETNEKLYKLGDIVRTAEEMQTA